jgi:hypothetical protein
MIKVEERERIRRAYFMEKKAIRRVAREYHHSRRVVREALKESAVPVYRRKQPVVTQSSSVRGEPVEPEIRKTGPIRRPVFLYF